MNLPLSTAFTVSHKFYVVFIFIHFYADFDLYIFSLVVVDLFVYFRNEVLVCHIACRYFLPACRLCFHFVFGFLCCAEVYKLD